MDFQETPMGCLGFRGRFPIANVPDSGTTAARMVLPTGNRGALVTALLPHSDPIVVTRPMAAGLQDHASALRNAWAQLVCKELLLPGRVRR